MATMLINTVDKGSKINRNIYGHFSEHLGRCIYGGLFVGENSPIENVNGMRKDVVDALKAIKIPVLRWPGGCFADEYHWKDGIGEKETRKKMVNTHWGGVVEDNSFGTHEFMELCSQLGCEPYINGNVGSGTVQEMNEWVEYLTFEGISPMADLRKKNGREKPWSVKYFGVGNENWGCGGSMRPAYYADEYRRYQTYVRNYGENKIYKIACGSNGDDYKWTDTLMSIAGNHMDGLSLHHYSLPTNDWKNKGSATEFDAAEYYSTLRCAYRMEEIVTKHSAIMDKYDPSKRVGMIVDEWGGWYDVEPGTNPGFLYQQNTMRDAVLAALTLNIFNSHCDRVQMANIAQTVNVLQSVILTEGEKMLLTPTYHVFDMYKSHQDAFLLYSSIITDEVNGIPKITQSASVDGDGVIHITVANLSAEDTDTLSCTLIGLSGAKVSARILTGKITEHNTFEAPTKVNPEAFTDFAINGELLTAKLPPCSVIEFTACK